MKVRKAGRRISARFCASMYSDALQTCGYNRFEEGQKEKRMIKGRVGCVAGSVFLLCTERKIAGLPDASGKGGMPPAYLRSRSLIIPES